MKFTIVDEIPFSLEQVFEAHRDKLPQMVDRMPNIDRIVVESREEDGDITRLVNVWHAAETDIPAIARAFISKDMLRWTDRAEWDAGERTAQWNIELGFLPGAIICRGENTFESYTDHTRITMEGELIIHAEKIPGVPKLLAGKIGPTIEKFVVGLIEPNLRETNKVVAAYLESLEG